MKKTLVIILVALLTGLGFAVFGRVKHNRLTLTKMRSSFRCEYEMRALVSALSEFRLIYDKYPTGTPEQIVAALQGANPRKIMFLDWLRVPQDRGNTPIDPWGATYRIEVNGTNVTVSSAGPDQRFGTSDDRHTDEVPNQVLEK